MDIILIFKLIYYLKKNPRYVQKYIFVILVSTHLVKLGKALNIRVLDVNSHSIIKNLNFNVDLKNMTKLVRIDTSDNGRRWERRPLGKFKGQHSQCRLLHLKFMDLN